MTLAKAMCQRRPPVPSPVCCFSLNFGAVHTARHQKLRPILLVKECTPSLAFWSRDSSINEANFTVSRQRHSIFVNNYLMCKSMEIPI